MKSIKSRLTVSYLFIITITVAILEVFLIFAIKEYYYNNMENMIFNQMKVSVDFYNSYLSSSSLKKNVQDNADIFWKNTSAEVQIIDKSGEMLMDSMGNFIEGKIQGDDVEKALRGVSGAYVTRDKTSKEKILYASYPLKSSNGIEGVLRFVTSLEEVDKVIIRISWTLIIIGIAVVLIAGIASIFLSDTIIKPLEEVTDMARKIASGRFNERINKKRDDEIGELSDTLNFMADEILKNDKLKNEFIASVSHELRTPLTSIKGWAMTIRTGDLEDKEEILDGLEIIEKESERLSSLVEELLDFSKFVSGKISLIKKPIDIKNIIEYIQKQMSPRALRQNINFTIEMEKDLSVILLDENRIKQVLINVLDNAFNFTDEKGSIEIKVTMEKNNLLLNVKDSGVGIPEEDLPRVTEKFFKGSSSKSGSGIGLSICKEIIDLHGGEFRITSEYGKGAQVSIRLPIQ